MSIPGVVYVTPPVKPPPVNPDEGWNRLIMTWTGWNGDVIDLTDNTDGLELKAGVEGLLMPSFTHFRDESPARPGSFWRGRNTAARPCFWPIRLFDDSTSRSFIDTHERLAGTLHPDRPGTWSVRSKNGVRTLRARYDKGFDGALDRDPTFYGWVDYGIALTADDPFWEGETIFQTWEAPEARDFISEDGAPDFWISDATSMASAVMSNPGDEDAYPIWIIFGPASSVRITFAGQVLDIPFAIPDGKALTIDTRPTEQTAIDSDGVDRTAELGAYGFAAVPPGLSQPFSIEFLGQGILRAALTPLYWKAF